MLAFEPAGVTRIDLADADADLTIARDAAGRWTLQARNELLSEPGWVLDGAPIDAALAAIASASITPASAAPSSDRHATNLVLHQAQTRIELTVHPPIAARAAVYADPPRRWFTGPADAFHSLTAPAVSAMRTSAALPSASVNVHEIAIRPFDADEILLRREGARWRLEEPAIAPADDDAVQRLLSTLAALRFSSLRSLPDAPPLSPPLAISLITFAESGETSAGVPVEESLVFASTDGRGPLAASRAKSGPLYPLQAADMRAIPTDPAKLVDPHASPVPPHDLAAISIDFISPPVTRRLRREIDGWTASDLLPDQTASRPVDVDAREAETLLRWLLATPAQAVRLEHAGAHEEPLARIRLLDVSDRPLDDLTLVRSARHPDAPATRTGKALRVFPVGTPTPALLTP